MKQTKVLALMVGTFMALQPSVFAQVKLTADNVDQIVASMTLEEKAHMVNGIGTFWGGSASCRNLRDVPGLPGGTYEISRLGVPGIYFGDGPLGLRIDEVREFDNHHYYVTNVPVPLLVGSSWDPSVNYNVAQVIAEECRDYGVDVMLGPSINLLRNPLGGRTHEYYSEDPYLTGIMATSFIEGVQSVGIGASIKHFAANNQETNRNAVNSIISQRALRELYLRSFEIAITKSQPWTVMSSYNGLNGHWTSENKELLEDVLRGDWGFKGAVMTDWGGGRHPVLQMLAGNDLLEAGSESAAQQIVDAVKDGTLPESVLDRNVRRVLELVTKTYSYKNYPFSNNPDMASHRAMARSSAAEGAILLKNDNNALPFASSIKKVAIYGKTGYKMIPGGIGWFENSDGNYSISLVEGLRLAGYDVDYGLVKANTPELNIFGPQRNPMDGPAPVEEMEIPAEDLKVQSSNNDIALIVLGHIAGEGIDRKKSDFYFTDKEKQLLKDVTAAYHAAGKKAVVILNIPGPVEVESWKDIPDAILCVYQGGEQIGNWIADVLKGAVTPSGKLTTTFAIDIMDYPSSNNYPIVDQQQEMSGMMAQGARFQPKDNMTTDGERNKDYTLYEEGIYVGYRYFDTFGVKVSYPFGYGLSYTTFKYSDPKIVKSGDNFTVSVTVTNTGKYKGKEVVQLYVAAPKSKLEKPKKELRSFAKTRLLAPGESETLSMTVSVSDLASFNSAASRWETDKGTYTFMVAASVSDVKAELTGKVDKLWTKPVRNVLAPPYDLKELTAKK
ncbi:MAG: glycoside hydrolase family 3 C-terminal domain-containing protein [Bacteroidales bacterium]|nr:glycoside hydrolase family 3 C-terminal domain-containing protein [Bacteroidales bacterium]